MATNEAALIAIWQLDEFRPHFRVAGNHLVCDAHGAAHRATVVQGATDRLESKGFVTRAGVDSIAVSMARRMSAGAQRAI